MAGLLMKQIVLWSISPGNAVVRSAAPFRLRSDREKQLSLAYRGQVYRAIIEGPERQIGVFVNYTGHRGPKEYIVLPFFISNRGNFFQICKIFNVRVQSCFAFLALHQIMFKLDKMHNISERGFRGRHP